MSAIFLSQIAQYKDIFHMVNKISSLHHWFESRTTVRETYLSEEMP